MKSRKNRYVHRGLLGVTALTLVACAGCVERDVSAITPANDPVVPVFLDVEVNRKLDLLFVIDDSGSMKNEQEALSRNFGLLMDQLTTVEHGVPDIHLGVISTDLGLGEFADQNGSCSTEGQGGRLLATPRDSSCAAPDGRFLTARTLPDGSLEQNFSGDISDAFACIAELGDQGCGYEQPLEAMRRALDGSVAENAGFLRPDARLAVVFVTDEDDCSVIDPAIFNELLVGEFGPPTDFRCFLHGVVCEDDQPAELGAQRGCVARQDSPYVADVGEYVEFLRGLKRYPERDILVAGIIGDAADPVAIIEDQQGFPKVAQSCFASDEDREGAYPPIRLGAFFDAFAQRQTVSICEPELARALSDIGAFIGPPPEGVCIADTLADRYGEQPGLQADCAVEEISTVDGERRREVVSVCDDPVAPLESSELPCYTIRADPDQCEPDRPLLVEAHYAPDAVLPPGSEVSVHCRGQ